MAYILCHGLTARLVTPLQAELFPGITAFASLLYLPHGVRVLSAWLLGGRAILPLAAGAFLSELLFTPPTLFAATDPVILVSILIGAAAAPAAFALMRLAGRPLAAGQERRVHWRWLLLAGMLASLLNSAGQGLVFADLIQPGQAVAVALVYALGDLAGLVATTLVLMMIFRWMRRG
ncbi:hypothetical protein ICN82_03745 [Mangrovicoccus sp. HB182678]|uniref:MASE1 domain-containing protein n=2 Tax=Mangrovicoccus algicola TaxID=2771008 RepID=A0A8J6Z4B9_9RHOB|nr:hypothetical protein [Mangrovicoccus algicola]MBE3637314.1 hypothetical protein [Mangrovicoccus algicola]